MQIRLYPDSGVYMYRTHFNRSVQDSQRLHYYLVTRTNALFIKGPGCGADNIHNSQHIHFQYIHVFFHLKYASHVDYKYRFVFQNITP